MSSLFIFIGIVVFFIIALSLWNRLQRKRGNEECRSAAPPAVKGGGCCGMHETCEKNTPEPLPRNDRPEYFDDEELDRYRDRQSSDYSEKEADEFREIFYSILDGEKSSWIKSLGVRRVAIPDQLKREMSEVITNLQKQKMQA